MTAGVAVSSSVGRWDNRRWSSSPCEFVPVRVSSGNNSAPLMHLFSSAFSIIIHHPNHKRENDVNLKIYQQHHLFMTSPDSTSLSLTPLSDKLSSCGFWMFMDSFSAWKMAISLQLQKREGENIPYETFNQKVITQSIISCLQTSFFCPVQAPD